MLRLAAAAIVFCLVLAGVGAPWPAADLGGPAAARAADTPSPAELRERAKKALGKEMQARLPEDDSAVAPAPRPMRERDGDGRRYREGSGGSAVGSFFMWTLIAVIAVLIGLFLYNELAGYERVARAEAGGAAGADDEAMRAVVERPLGDAEQLAGAGRYSEAIHVLLLRTFEELMRRLDRPLPRSKTSREILAEARLHPEAHGALAHLVSAVEISFFGGAAPGADDYRVCVERFRRFAAAYRGGPA